MPDVMPVAPAPPPLPPPLTEKDLRHWKLLRSFQERLETVFGRHALHPSWADPKRRLAASRYLSLFFFGLLNPVAQTLRGLAAASQWERVQEEVCGQAVARTSFSDAQHLLDPALLEAVLSDLARDVPAAAPDARLADWAWQARDGSLFRALPRMTWALYGAGAQGAPHRAVRLHLSLQLLADKPARAAVRHGRDCERAVWEEQWEQGAGYVGDRYFGENYQLFGRLDQKGCAYVIRLLDQAVITVEEELSVSAADQAAGVTRQAWVRLGRTARYRSGRLRLVGVQGDQTTLLLATNLSPEALSAELVSLLYRKRWQVELYFRWIKCVLGCGHWLAESARGTTIQIYLALIASVLLQLHTGRRPNKRMMELVRWYLPGWATGEELSRGLERYRSELARRAKKT
jgi:hypothetical protein